MSGAQWLIFTGAGVVAFAILEGWAFVAKRDDAFYTTSLRRWLGVNPRRWWRQVTFALWVGFFAWLTYHLFAVTS